MKEFFINDRGTLSMGRLCYFIVTTILCIVVLHMELRHATDPMIIGILASMGAGSYGIGKIHNKNNT